MVQCTRSSCAIWKAFYIFVFLILGTLVLSLVSINLVNGQAQRTLGKIALTATRFDTRELKLTVLLDMRIYFKESQDFDWLLMHLVHIDKDIFREVSYINLTRDRFDDKKYEGTGELVFELPPSNMYPFDEYNITIILYNHESFNRTQIYNPYITFDLENQLQSYWIEKEKLLDITSNTTLLPDGRDFVYFSIVISRQTRIVLGLLSPIFLSLVILYLAAFLDMNRRDWLSNRIKVYVSLFVFMFTYQSVIQSNAPLRMSISPAEVLIYLVALNTVILFFISVLKSYSGGGN